MSHNPALPDSTTTPLPPADERLERYLDGLMSDGERAAFESASAGDPTVAAQVAAHRRLTATLGQLYDTSGLPAAADAPLPRTLPLRAKHSPRRLVKLAAIAASIAIPAAAAVWYFAPREQAQEFKPLTSEQYQQKNRELMLAEYKKQLASGFKPREVCTTDEQFAKWTKDTFGHALKPTHPAPGSGAPPEPVLAGWSKGTIFSAYTGLLLASVDGQPVMVVMDHAPPDRMVPPEDATGSPRLFRRQVNGVWLIEVTPLDRPRVITNIEAGEGPKPE